MSKGVIFLSVSKKFSFQLARSQLTTSLQGYGTFYFLNKYRKKGYATNAVALIVHYAFNELRLNKLNVSVNEGNVPSETLIQKIGCKKEGVFKENVFYDGKYVNVNLYGMTGEQFYDYLIKYCVDKK